MINTIIEPIGPIMVWSKKLAQQLLLDEKNKLVKKVEEYCFRPEMLALYNFAKDPIFNKYRSLILDKEEGLILSKQSSRQILHDFCINHLHLGLPFQKHLTKLLGQKYFHTVSLWNQAYFSINGFCQKDTDWVSLHAMNNVRVEKNVVYFESNKIEGKKHNFAFENCERHFFRRVSEGITHHWALVQLMEASQKLLHFDEISASKMASNILTNPDYLLKDSLQKSANLNLKDVIDFLHETSHHDYGRRIAKEFGFEISNEDQKRIYSLFGRRNSIY